MLSLRLLYRNLRSPEVRILGLATIMAVALVSGIAMFTDRLEKAMEAESHAFIAADRVLRSSKKMPSSWATQAADAGLDVAQTVTFASMVFRGEASHLAAVKAVSDGYPLVGQLETRDEPFGNDPVQYHKQGPKPGEVWVEARLFPLLNMSLGEQLEVGERLLTVTQVLINEPDRGQGFMNFGARVLMHTSDLASTGVLQEGSRASFNLLLAGPSQTIDRFIQTMEPGLSVHERVVDVATEQRRVANSLDMARKFLMLSSIFGVLLAGIAIAIAAQRFCNRHIDQVALLKSLGSTTRQIRLLYLGQLIWLGIGASIVGLVVGDLLQSMIARSIAELLTVSLPPPNVIPALLGVAAGFFSLLFFALPPLWPLPRVAPIKILRRETSVPTTPKLVQLGLGVITLFCLMWLYTGAFKLSLAVIVVWTLVAVVAGVMATGGIWLLTRYGELAGSQWRLALASLRRRKSETTLQIVVFGTALMLLSTLMLVQGSLLDEWKLQLPPTAPNHFVVNIAPHEINDFEALIAQQNLTHSGLYPLVRGRLTMVNGEQAKAHRSEGNADSENNTSEESSEPEALTRELNLSWSALLPEGNTLIEGDWWTENQALATKGAAWVSVEQGMARSLSLKLGDTLQFSVGGLTLDAQVASIRTLHWDSMKPNFYVLFEPGALNDFAPMFMTSLYVPPEQTRFVATLLQQHPTVSVIEMEKIFAQIRAVIAQVSGGIQLVFWLVLVAALMVLMSALTASMDGRIQEVGLLRAMGATRAMLSKRLLIEFTALGLIAGVIAAIGADGLLWWLQTSVFKLQWHPHPWVWLATPAFGAVVIGLLGGWSCRQLLSLSPMTVLRMAE